MEKILNQYTINEQTMALIPAAHMAYDTIVLERDHQLYVSQTPLEIIKTTCLHHGSSYDGRRKAVMYKTGFKKKTPIPIRPSKNIYCFPTHSPTDFKCSWILYNHIATWKQFQSVKKSATKSVITFKNSIELQIDVSPFILEKQMQRTFACMV